MLVLGLTGAIAVGKSTVAGMFAERGVAVFDADRAVHALYAGAAAPLIEAAFAGTTTAGVVDRNKLAARVIGDQASLARLEAIIHPLVHDVEGRFRADAAAAGHRVALLDIPLLFENGRERDVDAIIAVTTGPEVAKARFLERPGMSEERYAALSARQMGGEEKCRRAHFIVDTTGDFAATRRQVAAIMRAVAGMAGGR